MWVPYAFMSVSSLLKLIHEFVFCKKKESEIFAHWFQLSSVKRSLLLLNRSSHRRWGFTFSDIGILASEKVLHIGLPLTHPIFSTLNNAKEFSFMCVRFSSFTQKNSYIYPSDKKCCIPYLLRSHSGFLCFHQKLQIGKDKKPWKPLS